MTTKMTKILIPCKPRERASVEYWHCTSYFFKRPKQARERWAERATEKVDSTSRVCAYARNTIIFL